MKKIVIMTDRKNELSGLMKCLNTVFPGCEIRTLPGENGRTRSKGPEGKKKPLVRFISRDAG